jgi:hypothetical protein
MGTNASQTTAPAEPAALDLRVGELVEVRSEGEILATLDEQGRLDRLPFMPEILQFAGRRLRVYKRATKACDTIPGVVCICTADYHLFCPRSIYPYWREIWLRRVE